MSSLAKNYNRRKIAFKYGKGAYLYSTKGKKYLDFVQGIAIHWDMLILFKKTKISSRQIMACIKCIHYTRGKISKKTNQNTAHSVIFQNSGVGLLRLL